MIGPDDILPADEPEQLIRVSAGNDRHTPQPSLPHPVKRLTDGLIGIGNQQLRAVGSDLGNLDFFQVVGGVDRQEFFQVADGDNTP